MANLIDGAFASLGLLSIVVYGGLLANGSPPERALLVALGGGLAVGVLLHFVLHFVQSPTEDEAKPSEGSTRTSAEAPESDDNTTASNAEDPVPQVRPESGGRLREKAA